MTDIVGAQLFPILVFGKKKNTTLIKKNLV